MCLSMHQLLGFSWVHHFQGNNHTLLDYLGSVPDISIKRTEDSFNMGVFFLPRASFIIGTFQTPNAHPGTSYWSRLPPPPQTPGELTH